MNIGLFQRIVAVTLFGVLTVCGYVRSGQTADSGALYDTGAHNIQKRTVERFQEKARSPGPSRRSSPAKDLTLDNGPWCWGNVRECSCSPGRECIVWMTGGGKAFRKDIVLRLRNMRHLLPEDKVDIVVFTPTGNIFPLRDYRSYDLKRIKEFVEAHPSQGHRMHMIASSAAVHWFKLSVYPVLRRVGFIFFVQPFSNPAFIQRRENAHLVSDVDALGIITLDIDTPKEWSTKRKIGSGDVRFFDNNNGDIRTWYIQMGRFVPDMNTLYPVHTKTLSLSESWATRTLRMLVEMRDTVPGYNTSSLDKQMINLVEKRVNKLRFEQGDPIEALDILRQRKDPEMKTQFISRMTGYENEEARYSEKYPKLWDIDPGVLRRKANDIFGNAGTNATDRLSDSEVTLREECAGSEDDDSCDEEGHSEEDDGWQTCPDGRPPPCDDGGGGSGKGRLCPDNTPPPCDGQFGGPPGPGQRQTCPDGRPPPCDDGFGDSSSIFRHNYKPTESIAPQLYKGLGRKVRPETGILIEK